MVSWGQISREEKGRTQEGKRDWHSDAFFWAQLSQGSPTTTGMRDPQKYLWVSKKLAVSDSQPVGEELEMPGCMKGDGTLLL